ncbi:hypothetical protein CYMTET_40168 [Cymbomonas tetramitiformis]|uniref:Uncharacterized protein n=1 Tax=Cymbomonas tetramitiformis TaxID=36881 RepID=A0AAE0C8L8_9CHLO|nr:hypothetical protein CYMTET_40168 [Cymbomonas tetramitiformis]
MAPRNLGCKSPLPTTSQSVAAIVVITVVVGVIVFSASSHFSTSPTIDLEKERKEWHQKEAELNQQVQRLAEQVEELRAVARSKEALLGQRRVSVDPRVTDPPVKKVVSKPTVAPKPRKPVTAPKRAVPTASKPQPQEVKASESYTPASLMSSMQSALATFTSPMVETPTANENAPRDPRNFMADLNYFVLGTWNKEEFVPAAFTALPEGDDWQKAMYYDTAQRYRMFDKGGAQDCLRNKKVAVLGDSYMVGFYVGLLDVATGETTTQSRYAISSDAYVVENHFHAIAAQQKDMDLRLHYGKWAPCSVLSMNRRIDRNDTKMMNRLADWATADYVVMNALMHDIKIRGILNPEMNLTETQWLDSYVVELRKMLTVFQQYKINLVWATGPSHDQRYVDKQYQPYQNDHRLLRYNTAAAQVVVEEFGYKFLDVFHMTHACKSKLCYDGVKGDGSKRGFDGHHRSRMNNRMKAQMLLNHICPQPAKEGNEISPPKERPDFNEMHKYLKDKVRT